MSNTKHSPFGHAVLPHFCFAEGYRSLNHGSFGTYPQAIRDALRKFQDEAEGRPDLYQRFSYKKYLEDARNSVAELLNADVNSLVFVNNATSGVNTVLRNLVYQPQDVVLYFDTVYGACEKTVLSIAETVPNMTLERMEYQMPCSFEDIVKLFTDTIAKIRENGMTPKVLLFDTVCSVPGIRFPFEALTAECKKHQILSCVDAAHAIGMIQINIKKLDPDFFVTNCHKWMYTPRGSAALYVAERNHSLIRTTYPTSHGFVPPPKDGSSSVYNPLPSSTASAFQTLFQFVATQDNAPYYCSPAALEWRRKMFGSEEAIYKYLEKLAYDGGNLVAAKLNTKVLTDPGEEVRKCALVNVRLPLTFGDGPDEIAQDKLGEVLQFIQETAMHEKNTFLFIFSYKGQLYTRLSAQTYLELEDFEWAADVLLEMCDRARRDFGRKSQ